MASKDQHIEALIRLHMTGDHERFVVEAKHVAQKANEAGKSAYATKIHAWLDSSAARPDMSQRAKSAPMLTPPPTGKLAGLLAVRDPKTRINEMMLGGPLPELLRRVVHEQRERDRLREHGFSLMRKLLLVGPPGTGKTMTASALAGELGLPLFTVQLHGLITQFLGETAAKLRVVFDAIQSTRGVYLFDEFDALGGERGSKNDVGEIRRVLNSFLQFLEQDDSDSVVLGATNHVGLLDRALFRRFDAVLEYALPTRDIALDVMQARLALLETSAVDWAAVAECTNKLSHAELVQACDLTAKDALLGGTKTVDTAGLRAALAARQVLLRASGREQEG